VPRSWIGPIITLAIVAGAGLFLYFNMQTPAPPRADDPAKVGAAAPGTAAGGFAGFQEFPIGEEVERDGMRVAAVWLPTVQLDDRSVTTSDDVIHLEADVAAAANNPQGLADGEFIPYLDIEYEIRPASAGATPVRGRMAPMVARDGLHYGATIPMPPPGSYKLVYSIPSPAGLGRHSDPVTGVAPWWGPFEVAFDWKVTGREETKPASDQASK